MHEASEIEKLTRAVEALTHALREISNSNGTQMILQRIEGKIDKMANTIDEILSEVEEEKTLIDGISTFIDGLKQQIIDAGVDKTKLAQVVTNLNKNKEALAAALQANVPPAQPPAP